LAGSTAAFQGAAAQVINRDSFEERLTKSRFARLREAAGAGNNETHEEKQA
jgi:hypothetical protein